MADKNIVKSEKSERRRRRTRGKVFGTATRPRLTVTKSLKNVTAQVIDDEKGVTLIGLTSLSKEIASTVGKEDTKTVIAGKLGKKIAEMAKAKGIQQVVFDRNHHRYHGRIKAVADGAREGGLQF